MTRSPRLPETARGHDAAGPARTVVVARPIVGRGSA